MYEFRIVRIEAQGNSELRTTTDLTELCEWFEFTPAAAPVELTWTAGSREGAWPVAQRVGNVEETVTAWTLGNASAARAALNAAFQQARTWGIGFRRDMRIVIQVRNPCVNTAFFEAQLYGGSAVPVDAVGRQTAIKWTRAPYWMGQERTMGLRTALNGAYADYADLYNCDDARPGYNNWVIVEPPVGTVPALARIRIQNTYADDRMREVRMGWYDRPNNLILEGENSELSPDITNDAERSNQAYAAANGFRWTLPWSTVRDLVGEFRVLSNGSLAGQRWRLAVGVELTREQTLRYVAGANGWTDLGQVSLPPGGYVAGERYPVRVWLESEDGLAGGLDFVHFVPVEQARRIRFRGYDALPGTCVVDDGIRDELYYEFGTQKLAILDGWGTPIQLRPEALLPYTWSGQQMITFGFSGPTGNADAKRTARVQIAARPRWDVLPDF